jgi:UDP-N-acetylglucosamine transferase subunit ALG13
MEKRQYMKEGCYKKMIFITVGTHYQGFERLIKKADEIASKIDEEIIAQIGSTKYIPKNMNYFSFMRDEEKFLELYKKARIIITHAGVGNLFNIYSFQKPVIIVPRLKKFNEHIDNHQLEITEVLKNQKQVVVIYDIENLENALKRAKKITCKKNKKLVTFLKDYIKDMKK